MNSRVYEVNISRLGRLLLPMLWRKPLMNGLIESLVAPLGENVEELHRFRSGINSKMNYTGQVCRLRAMLNDRFDESLRRLKVEDSQRVEEIRLFRAWLKKPRQLKSRLSGVIMVLNTRRGVEMSGYDFWITVPNEMKGMLDEKELIGAVGEYKLASKRVTINYK